MLKNQNVSKEIRVGQKPGAHLLSRFTKFQGYQMSQNNSFLIEKKKLIRTFMATSVVERQDVTAMSCRLRRPVLFPKSSVNHKRRIKRATPTAH